MREKEKETMTRVKECLTMRDRYNIDRQLERRKKDGGKEVQSEKKNVDGKSFSTRRDKEKMREKRKSKKFNTSDNKVCFHNDDILLEMLFFAHQF